MVIEDASIGNCSVDFARSVELVLQLKHLVGLAEQRGLEVLGVIGFQAVVASVLGEEQFSVSVVLAAIFGQVGFNRHAGAVQNFVIHHAFGTSRSLGSGVSLETILARRNRGADEEGDPIISVDAANALLLV